MTKYKFNAVDIVGVLSHVVAYDATILSMVPDGNDYVMDVSVKFPEEEYQHLVESYPGFEEIV